MALGMCTRKHNSEGCPMSVPFMQNTYCRGGCAQHIHSRIASLDFRIDGTKKKIEKLMKLLRRIVCPRKTEYLAKPFPK